MQMTDVDYNGVLVRVTRLETQNRFWKVAGLMMLLAAVVSRSCLSSGRVTALVCAVCPNNEGERTTRNQRMFSSFMRFSPLRCSQ
jgi:hypothetical protein